MLPSCGSPNIMDFPKHDWLCIAWMWMYFSVFHSGTQHGIKLLMKICTVIKEAGLISWLHDHGSFRACKQGWFLILKGLRQTEAPLENPDLLPLVRPPPALVQWPAPPHILSPTALASVCSWGYCYSSHQPHGICVLHVFLQWWLAEYFFK